MSGSKTCALPHKIDQIRPVPSLTSTNKGDLEREMASIRRSLAELRKNLLNTFTVQDTQRKYFDFDHLPARYEVDVLSEPVNIPNNAFTKISWDKRVFDTYDYIDFVTDPTRAIFLVGGVYRITASVVWDGTLVGDRRVHIVRNGVTGVPIGVNEVPPDGAATVFGRTAEVNVMYTMLSMDYIDVQLFQNSGGILPVEKLRLELERVRHNDKPPERGRVAGRFEETTETDAV